MNIIQNIQGIIALVAVIIVNIVGIVKAVSAVVKQIKSVQEATAEEKEAAKAEAKAAIIDILRPMIFGWVSDAEKALGGGIGKLKSSMVACMVYEKIPDDLKPMFSAKEIQDLIDEVLREAQKYWDKNAKAREYIESGTGALIAAEVGQVISSGADAQEIAKAVSEHISEAIEKAAEAAMGATDVRVSTRDENVVYAAQDAPTEG